MEDKILEWIDKNKAIVIVVTIFAGIMVQNWAY